MGLISLKRPSRKAPANKGHGNPSPYNGAACTLNPHSRSRGRPGNPTAYAIVKSPCDNYFVDYRKMEQSMVTVTNPPIPFRLFSESLSDRIETSAAQ